MNFCLGGIGINFPEHRKRAIAIGETVGVYRYWPVSKGCTSPFAPIWINEMVSPAGVNAETGPVRASLQLCQSVPCPALACGASSRGGCVRSPQAR